MTRPIAGFDQLASRAGDTFGLLSEQQNRQDWAMAKNAAQAWGNAKASALQADATKAQAQYGMLGSVFSGLGRLGGAVAGQLGAGGGDTGGGGGGGQSAPPAAFSPDFDAASTWQRGFSMPDYRTW